MAVFKFGVIFEKKQSKSRDIQRYVQHGKNGSDLTYRPQRVKMIVNWYVEWQACKRQGDACANIHSVHGFFISNLGFWSVLELLIFSRKFSTGVA